MRILYVGPRFGTSGHRAAALQRLGHDVTIADVDAALGDSRLVRLWMWHTGGRFLERRALAVVRDALADKPFDLAWVNGGELAGPALLGELKRRCAGVVNYNNDDPFGGRDGNRWRLYRKALPLYDVVAVVRECNVAEAYAAGARRVERVLMSADEVAHAPRQFSPDERREWASEVAFIGTWMPERGELLETLVRLGTPLTIYGDRWHKARQWHSLQPYWGGPGRFDTIGYARMVQSAKVCLGLLSKGNRDQSTTRSFEIPMLGGVLCAERTPEHMRLYEEDREALFWSSPEECALQCRRLLDDPVLREHVAGQGRRRCLANGATNEQVMSRILEAAGAGTSRAVAGASV